MKGVKDNNNSGNKNNKDIPAGPGSGFGTRTLLSGYDTGQIGEK